MHNDPYCLLREAKYRSEAEGRQYAALCLAAASPVPPAPTVIFKMTVLFLLRRETKEKVCLLRAADNPRISKSIGPGRATIRDSPRCHANLAGFLGCGGFSLTCRRAYLKSPEFPLRFANAGIGVCRDKGQSGFRGNLGGSWLIVRRGRGLWEKCGVVGNGERLWNKYPGTLTAETAGVAMPSRRGGGLGSCYGVIALGKDHGTNALKPEPRKRPAWKFGEGLPRLTVSPKGWLSSAVLRGCGFRERPQNKCPETRTAKTAGMESWGRIAVIDRLPVGVAASS